MKRLYLDRLAEIYENALLLGDVAEKLWGEHRESPWFRQYVAMLSKCEELLRIKMYWIDEYNPSEEEMARSVAGGARAWSWVQSCLSSARAEKEGHGW